MWYDEIKDYDANKNTAINGKVVGHYTQVVWRNSTKVGFGVAMGTNNMVVLCANYDPPGNFVGQHPYRLANNAASQQSSCRASTQQPALQPVQPVQAAGKGVVVPPAGPEVDIQVARQKLRDNMPAQIAEFMKLHNDARAEVGVPPLQWDEKLAAVAQKWADGLAAKGSNLEHSDAPYGENLAGYLPQYGERPVHGAKMWYDEKAKYHGEAMEGDNYLTVGHYTQMVWAKTTKVGFGVAMAPDGMGILCANYEIGGNMRTPKTRSAGRWPTCRRSSSRRATRCWADRRGSCARRATCTRWA